MRGLAAPHAGVRGPWRGAVSEGTRRRAPRGRGSGRQRSGKRPDRSMPWHPSRPSSPGGLRVTPPRGVPRSTFTHLPAAPDFISPSPSNPRGGFAIALAAQTIVVPEARVAARPALTTLVPTLDRILGPFERGKITLVDSGSNFVFHLTTLLCVRAVMEGHEVVFLDGGNSVDPHGMVALGKRVGLTREEVLPRVHVARAFTCHQMTTLILDMLDKKMGETRAGMAVLACLPEMYLDEDVEVGEAHQLFQRSMRAIRRTVAERDVVGLVTNAGLAKLHRLDTGTSEWYASVPPDQTTLDDFDSAQPRILGFRETGGWRGIREGGYLRFG